ncbi:MAG: PEBP family protein [Nannocystaceae bacterium]
MKLAGLIHFVVACPFLLGASLSCSSIADNNNAEVNSNVDPADPLMIEAWADNWFAMYVGDQLIVEDSVSITTERSFNGERASFDVERPFVASFVLKDFKETDSGLEYIGANNQQMGDGGFIAQIFDQATGEVIAVTDSDWKCLVIHEAPLNKSCEGSSNPDADCEFRSDPEPDGWKSPEFDDSAWASATEHSESTVGPKDGYDAITWDGAASLIWGEDLEADNTVLCRVLIE